MYSIVCWADRGCVLCCAVSLDVPRLECPSVSAVQRVLFAKAAERLVASPGAPQATLAAIARKAL